jgi:hypothetical protein
MRFNLDNYETVEARLAKFWELCPNGRVVTEMVHYDENRVVFRAALYKDINDPVPVSTGFAEEVRDASPVNRTSHVENCETSSLGRAASNWVLSAKASPRPSREEMAKVERMNQTKPEMKPSDLLSKFREACAKAGLDPEAVAMEANVDLNALTDAVMPALRSAFKKINDGMNDKPKPEVQEIIDKVTAAFPGAIATDEPQIKDPGAKASSAQLGKIRAMLNGVSLNTRADQHDYIAEIINRPISALDELNKGEANAVIKALDARGRK